MMKSALPGFTMSCILLLACDQKSPLILSRDSESSERIYPRQDATELPTILLHTRKSVVPPVAVISSKNVNAVPYQEAISSYLPVLQTCEFSAERDTVIAGRKGTLVAFPAGILADENGKGVLGDVKLSLIEYTTVSECAAKSIFTQTMDDDVLETVGMVDIVATQNGDTLHIQGGRDITVAFPLESGHDDFKAWEPVWNQGVATWKELNSVAEKDEKEILVNMYTLTGDKDKNRLSWRTCNGKNWHSYFNNRFVFEGGTGDELLDPANFLAYSFKVDRSGKIMDLFVEPTGYPGNVVKLSNKYLIQMQRFFANYPALNLCNNPDYKKRTYRFIIRSGGKRVMADLISLSTQEGGFSTEELKAMYEKTGEKIYLDAWLEQIGTTNVNKAIPMVKKKTSRQILNAFVGAADIGARVILTVGTLGLINGDRAILKSTVKYRKGAAFQTMVSGSKAVLYMVFKRTRSFLQARQGRDRYLTFGDKIPGGEEVVMVAVSERDGKRFMQRLEYVTSDEDVSMHPDVEFDAAKLSKWLDYPDEG